MCSVFAQFKNFDARISGERWQLIIIINEAKRWHHFSFPWFIIIPSLYPFFLRFFVLKFDYEVQLRALNERKAFGWLSDKIAEDKRRRMCCHLFRARHTTAKRCRHNKILNRSCLEIRRETQRKGVQWTPLYRIIVCKCFANCCETSAIAH